MTNYQNSVRSGIDHTKREAGGTHASPWRRRRVVAAAGGILAAFVLALQSSPGTAVAASSAPSTVAVGPSGVPVPSDTLTWWRRTFVDDFTGSTPGKAWGYPYVGSPDAYTTWKPSHVGVQDGKLVIQAYRENGIMIAGGVANAAVPQKYGKWLVRMRIDKSDDMTYAILLWPAKGWPPEVDIAEDGGGDRHSNASTSIYGTASHPQQVQSQATADFSQWHTVGVDWSPGKLAYTLDGRQYGAVSGAAVPGQPMWLAIQAQSGGCQKGWVNRPKGCPLVGIPTVARLEVDWVAVFTPR